MELSYEEAVADKLSFAFVRHPVSRFVSGYSEKMVRDWRRKDIPNNVRTMRDQVLRQVLKTDPQEYVGLPTRPTSSQFQSIRVRRSQTTLHTIR